MAILKANFIILTAILNNVLYTNVPLGVQQMAIRFDNQTEWRKMNFSVVNNMKLNTFSIAIDEAKRYKLKLIFNDGTEGEFKDWHAVTTPPPPPIDLSDMSEPKYSKLYVVSCITLSSTLFIILKIIVKIINKKFYSSCKTKINA